LDAKKILHIGCGAYPVTAITIAKISEAKIVGIDKNPRSIKLARDIVKKRNLQTKIIIEHGNGMQYCLKDFDVIIISGCSYPKKQILERIFETAKPRSKIVFRSSYKPTKSILSCINSYKDSITIKKIENYPLIFKKAFGWQSFYLIKK